MPRHLRLWFMICPIGALGPLAVAAPAGAPESQPARVIVSSDIGGDDPDDFQSLVHLLVYADRFDLEGLIASPPGAGRSKHILEVLRAYEADYPRLKARASRFPSPESLRDMTRQGAIDVAPKEGFSQPTEGSRWIIRQADRKDDRPLYILVWGSITDVAQAVHDAPQIKKRIRILSIGGWNTKQDPHARQYLFDMHPDLWWVESNTTCRGMYVGGRQDRDLGNLSFVERHVRGHGALGDLYWAKKRDIKMGDTPSLLYLFTGNPDDPTGEHWGGQFKLTAGRATHWTDLDKPGLRAGNYNGAATVNRWRVDILRDWQKRMDWLLDTSGEPRRHDNES